MSEEVERGPGVSEAMHRQYLEARAKRLAAIAADEERVARLADESGATDWAIRLVEAEEHAKARERERREAIAAARSAVRAAKPAARSAGRSQWTDELFAERWSEACERSGPPYSYPHVLPEFVWLDGTQRIDTDPGNLGRLWRKHGRPEPSR